MYPRDNLDIYAADSGYTMKTEDGRDLSIPSHIDTTITLLAIYSNGGLQVLPEILGTRYNIDAYLLTD